MPTVEYELRASILMKVAFIPVAAAVFFVAACGLAQDSSNGCITQSEAGDHTFTCEGFRVDARVPAACSKTACGLILELHGDGGTGLGQDSLSHLREEETTLAKN